MQRIIHEYRNKSRIFNMIEGLYAYVSDTDYMFDDVLWLDNSFKDLCDILNSKLLIFNTPLLKEFDLPRVELSERAKCDTNKEITVCLSGGKDSAAAAFYYKQRGYKVHLYHAAGVNKAYGDEKLAAKRIADYLGCDLFIDKFQMDGTHRFIEHPMKNYAIADGAIHYCLAMGYKPVIAFGNFRKSILDMNEFEVCGGDCIEMWDAYRKIIQRVIPEFDIEIPLETNADTFRLLQDDWRLFGLAVSCMSPFRFREFWKHRTEQQFGVRMFDNRCGCCWKDCLEAMWLMDIGKMEYKAEYYMHCFGILASTIRKETGYPEEDVNSIWENYMFYPIEDSKAYSLLTECRVKHLANGSVWLLRGEEKYR